MKSNTISQDVLRSVLLYDGKSGVFTWRPRPLDGASDRAKARSWNTRYAGKPAGVETHGYIRLSVFDQKYYAHRLAFIYMTGECPDLVDHINNIGTDNRWSNLRGSCKSRNALNPLNTRRFSKTGITGVYQLAPGRFMAQSGAVRRATGNGYLGTFPTAEDAHAAYLQAIEGLRPK